MKIVIINSLIRAIGVLLVSLTSVVNIGEVKENKINVNNYAANRSASVVSTVIPATTEYKYNYKIPSGVTNVLKEGQDGIVYSDTTGNILKTLVPKINRVVEVGTGKYGEYTGIVTGYGPDCKTCDGRGYVACPTKTGKWTNLKTDGVYYTDEKYGKLKILAADFREFPCGTVMEVMNNDLSEPIKGIVLDTGSAMRYAYEHGYIHIDVAHEIEVGLRFNTNKNTKFSVKRWGW